MSPGRIDLFATRTDGNIWHMAYTGSSWSGWDINGDLAATSDPAAVSAAPGQIDIVARGPTNSIYQRSYRNGLWGPWTSLGGDAASSPAITSAGPGKLDVFVRGQDNAIWHKAFANGAWATWESLGGFLTSEPAAVALPSGYVYVFARGGDNALWSIAYRGQWGAWQSLGGVLASGPAANSYRGRRVDVFVVGTDAALYHRSLVGAVWTEYARLGGSYRDKPASVSWGTDRIDVVARTGFFQYGHQHTDAPARPLPPGSYLQSCNAARFDGITLQVSCPDSDGNWFSTGLYMPTCLSDPANIQGRLSCVSGGMPPVGSYLQTCINPWSTGTTLGAQCRTRGGDWLATTLNFANCAPGSIANINGTLSCAPPSSPPPPAACGSLLGSPCCITGPDPCPGNGLVCRPGSDVPRCFAADGCTAKGTSCCLSREGFGICDPTYYPDLFCDLNTDLCRRP